MEDTVDFPKKPVSRRDFLKIGLGAAIGSLATLATQKLNALTPITEPSINTPTPEAVVTESVVSLKKQEQLARTELTMYGDLTPGIGISVAWMGTNSRWNTIVENVFNATRSVNIVPFVFVPKHLEADFQEYVEKNGVANNTYNKVSCDPEYSLRDDSVNAETGKATKPLLKKGFISPWVRDYGTMVALKDGKLLQLNTRKTDAPDPLRGVQGTRKMDVIDPELKFDGGAYFDFTSDKGISYFIGAENELVNNNSYFFPKDKDPNEEAISRLKRIFGEKKEVVLLPSLKGSGVDHIDLQVLPLGGNAIVVGQANENDNNFPLLNLVAGTLIDKGLAVSRVPVRRTDDNIFSWVNGLPHVTKEGRKFMFMPTYDGYDLENKMAQEVYEKLGFTVVPVDATSVMTEGGAVHCATNTSMTAALIDAI